MTQVRLSTQKDELIQWILEWGGILRGIEPSQIVSPQTRQNPRFGHDSGVNCLVIQTALQEPRVLNWLKKKLTPTDDMAITMESHSGIGTLSCNDCGHAEQVHLFTHGFGPTSHCTEGVQCQQCAKFVTFDSEPVGEQGLPALKERVEQSRCECGGKFARDKLSLPKTQSNTQFLL